jgi:prepilin-type N-terminal cleavage/methylation domain-containing protein
MRGKRAYTLIEAIVTVVIFAILSVFVMIAATNAMRSAQLSNAAGKLASDLRYAQTMAGGTGTWYGVSFETAPLSQYTVYTTTGTADTIVEDPAKFGNLFIVRVNTDFGVTISGATIEGGKKVEFSPQGTPYADKTGSAILTEGVITLSKDSSARTVRITPQTGRVYIQ